MAGARIELRGGVGELRRGVAGDLERRLVRSDPDRAHLAPGDTAAPADERQHPARIGVVLGADVHAKEDRLSGQLRPVARVRSLVAGAESAVTSAAESALGLEARRRDRLNGLARRKASKLACQQAPDQRRRGQLGLQPERQRIGPFGDRGLVPHVRCQELHGQSLARRGRDRLARGERRPDRLDVRAHQKALCLAALCRRGDDHRRPLAPGPSGAAAPVGQRLGVERQIRVHDQIDVGQMEPARRHVGGDQDAHLAAPELIERAIALGLRAISRDRRRREPARDECRVQVGHRLAGGHEDDRALAVRRAQHVDHRPQAIAPRDEMRDVADVVVRLRSCRAARLRAAGIDRHRVPLKAFGHRPDLRGDRRRQQQRAPLGRRGLEDRLQILAKAEVQHLVGLVEDDRLQPAERQPLAPQQIDQATRRSDDDVDAALERPQIAAHRRAARERRQPEAGVRQQPGQLAADLGRELPRRDDHQRTRLAARFSVRRHRRGRRRACLGPRHAQQRLGDDHAERERLARPRLRRHQQVPPGDGRIEHCGLDARGGLVATGRQRLGQRREKVELCKIHAARGLPHFRAEREDHMRHSPQPEGRRDVPQLYEPAVRTERRNRQSSSNSGPGPGWSRCESAELSSM